MNFTDLLTSLNESNEGDEHLRMRRILKKYAESLGYGLQYDGFPKGSFPDVLLANWNNELFMGDAKDSNNETVNKEATTDEISKYLEQYSFLMENSDIKGGAIAIITNNEFAASEWEEWLEDKCAEYDISASFEVIKLPNSTFIIIDANI